MQYDDVIAAVFDTPPPPGGPDDPAGAGTPARRLRDALEPLAMHPVWSRRAHEGYAALGLDFLTAYVRQRAAALGEPSVGAVVATFAVFEPLTLGAVVEAGRAAPVDEVVRIREEVTTESLGEVLDLDDDAVLAVVEPLERAASALERAGRPLFSGLLDRPTPRAPVGRLWRVAELWREHRGDSHVAASVTTGLDAIEMNVLTELWLGYPYATYSATRFWSTEALDDAAARLADRGLLDDERRLTGEGRRFRDELEAVTDRAQESGISTLGGDIDRIVEVTDAWSQRLVDARLFPPDPRKRAAG